MSGGIMSKVFIWSCFILALLFGCGQFCTNRLIKAVAKGGAVYDAADPSLIDDPRIRITSLQIFAWWWSEKQLKLGVDRLNGSQPKSYLEFNQWKDTNDPSVPHPDKIDILCKIENGPKRMDHIFLEFTTDYLVAPIDYACKSSIKSITDEVSWSGEVKIRKDRLGSLVPHQQKKIMIKNFNLRDILQKFPGSKQVDYLWLWMLRIHVYLRNGDQTIARSEVNLSLLPRDGLCSK
jgi:hypothetical protein